MDGTSSSNAGKFPSTDLVTLNPPPEYNAETSPAPSKRLFIDARMEDRYVMREKKKVRQFYQHQNSIIDDFSSIDKLLRNEAYADDDAADRANLKARIAINGSFAINVILFGLKVYAALSSRSISVIASALDSFLDLLSGSIIFLTNYFVHKKSNIYNWPVGKGRLEPLGVIVFAACMFTATLQLLIQAAKILITQENIGLKMDAFTIAVIGSTIFVKLALFIFCRTVTSSESALALSQDHRNDVVSNSFGLTTALLGQFLAWWVDPLGGVIISIYIMFNWFRTGFSHVRNLTGRSACPTFLQSITYLAIKHDKRILKIDTVRAFYLGTGYMVEVDIVLPQDMPLKEAHDIGESLQMKIENVENVERAFVHLDYEYEHTPEHSNPKKLIKLDASCDDV